MEKTNEIEELFLKAYSNMSEEQVLEIFNRKFDGGINNVVNRINPHSFSIWLISDSPNVVYHLVHVSGKNNLEGDVIELKHNQEFRDEVVLYFCKFLSHNYPDLDLVDVFNTFQNHTRTLLETLEYWTYTNFDMKGYEEYNVSIIAKGKKGIVPLRLIDKVSFYKDFFGFKQMLHGAENYIYLMLNTRNNYIKIGKSKNPRFREKTLQADEPDVNVIAVWAAPGKLERLLHSKYIDNRQRGEWFKLSFRHLKEIKEEMLKY